MKAKIHKYGIYAVIILLLILFFVLALQYALGPAHTGRVTRPLFLSSSTCLSCVALCEAWDRGSIK